MFKWVHTCVHVYINKARLYVTSQKVFVMPMFQGLLSVCNVELLTR